MTLHLTTDEQAWLDEYRRQLRERFPRNVADVIVYGSKARGDDGPDSDVDVLVVIREGDGHVKTEVRLLGYRLEGMWDVAPSIMVYTGAEWRERAGNGSSFHRAVMRDGGAFRMNNEAVGEWKRAKESLGAARSCLRDEYYADSISRAYYAILHAAKAALELYGVSAERHTAVRRMFRLHLVETGLVEEQWADAIALSSDQRIHSDYDIGLVYSEADARESCESARSFLNRIHPLLAVSIPPEDLGDPVG